MTSLFQKLLHLRLKNDGRLPLEDYLTELVAYLLADDPPLLVAFLQAFQLTRLGLPLATAVDTQVGYAKLAEHEMSSRPDLVIRLSKGSDRSVLFVESKVGSKEGQKQLRRYAEHLAAQPTDVTECVLVYITRDYDPKQSTDILGNGLAATRVRFCQVRWYEVYTFLQKNYPHHWLAREVCRFMKHNRMTQNTKFTPVDTLALSNFRQVKSMMDETLDGAVLHALQDFGGDQRELKLPKAMQQYSQSGRYILMAWQKDYLWVGVGYWIDVDDGNSYPLVGVTMEVNAREAAQRKEIVDAMQVIQQSSSEWNGGNLTQESDWVNIMRRQPLHNFLTGENHLKSIREYLLASVEVLEHIKQKYTQLPWAKAFL